MFGLSSETVRVVGAVMCCAGAIGLCLVASIYDWPVPRWRRLGEEFNSDKWIGVGGQWLGLLATVVLAIGFCLMLMA